MNNLVSLWLGLSLAKRLVLVAATLGMFVAILAVARVGSSAEQSLLYAGLSGRAAGEVISALEQAGVAYEVRGESVYVPAAERDALRMQLASQGLPASGGVGYELLDGLSGFGTTSQMFDAAYWRAKEGELARTVLSMPQIKAARVHISQGNLTGFLRDQPLTASITVTTSGGSLSAEQADALRHLIASAVGSLQARDVAVIDSVAGLIAVPEAASALAAGDARAQEIKRNVERLLAARVGAGRAVVEVSLDLVRDREAITERRIDPQERVAISSETEQNNDTSRDGAADVTVASNLPDGDGAAGASGESQSTSSRERVNYEVSQTEREVLREPGAIRRLTVAVLIDGVETAAADGTMTWEPRSDAEMADLRELVASAAGVDEARGDVLTLKSLQFQPPVSEGSVAQAGLLSMIGPLNVMSIIQMLVLSLVALVLGMFVLRPLLLQRGAPAAVTGAGTLALPGPSEAAAGPALTGEISDGYDLPDLAVDGFGATALAEHDTDDPVARLRRLIDQRQSESVEILRSWMEKEEERR